MLGGPQQELLGIPGGRSSVVARGILRQNFVGIFKEIIGGTPGRTPGRGITVDISTACPIKMRIFFFIPNHF